MVGSTPNKVCVRPIEPQEGELLPLQVGGSSSSGEQGNIVVTDNPAVMDSVQGEPVREDLGERVQTRARMRPVAPSAKEVAEHEVTHYPYREWRRYCVASAGRRDGHKKISDADQDGGIATIAADYCYFNDQEKCDESGGDWTERSAILVMKDRATGAIFSDVVPEKGVYPKVVDTVVDHVVWLGHPKIKLRSGGGRSIKALLEKVSEDLKTKGLHIVPDTTPVGDSHATGLQESAAMEFNVKCRTLWFQACELHIGAGLGAGRKGVQRLLPWCVQYVGQLITRTRKDATGQTAWTKITGRRVCTTAYPMGREGAVHRRGRQGQTRCGTQVV